jgi:hypothetical protein
MNINYFNYIKIYIIIFILFSIYIIYIVGYIFAFDDLININIANDSKTSIILIYNILNILIYTIYLLIIIALFYNNNLTKSFTSINFIIFVYLVISSLFILNLIGNILQLLYYSNTTLLNNDLKMNISKFSLYFNIINIILISIIIIIYLYKYDDINTYYNYIKQIIFSILNYIDTDKYYILINIIILVIYASIIISLSIIYSKPQQIELDILNKHNYYRNKENAPNLTWDDNLVLSAKKWARKCNLEHENQQGQGDNLYMSIVPNNNASIDAIDDWYSEKSIYINNKNINSKTGHYTQLAWKNTNKVGCYNQFCKNMVLPHCPIQPNRIEKNANYIVCRYSPQGNIIGTNYKTGKSLLEENVN